MDRRVFIDTSAFYALADSGDINHERAVKIYNNLLKKRYEFLLSDMVFAETVTLIRRRLGYRASLMFSDTLKEGIATGLFEIIFVTESLFRKSLGLFFQIKDRKISFVDATSLTIIKEKGIKKAFAFDVHFDGYKT